MEVWKSATNWSSRVHLRHRAPHWLLGLNIQLIKKTFVTKCAKVSTRIEQWALGINNNVWLDFQYQARVTKHLIQAQSTSGLNKVARFPRTPFYCLYVSPNTLEHMCHQMEVRKSVKNWAQTTSQIHSWRKMCRNARMLCDNRQVVRHPHTCICRHKCAPSVCFDWKMWFPVAHIPWLECNHWLDHMVNSKVHNQNGQSNVLTISIVSIWVQKENIFGCIHSRMSSLREQHHVLQESPSTWFLIADILSSWGPESLAWMGKLSAPAGPI